MNERLKTPREDALMLLASVVLNAWAGGEIDGSDFLVEDEEPEELARIVKLATDNEMLIAKLLLEGELERIIANWLQREGAVT